MKHPVVVLKKAIFIYLNSLYTWSLYLLCFMYLWHILSREADELILRVYNTQKVGDWVKFMNAEKDELGIELTDQDIQDVSQEMFKNM